MTVANFSVWCKKNGLAKGQIKFNGNSVCFAVGFNKKEKRSDIFALSKHHLHQTLNSTYEPF